MDLVGVQKHAPHRLVGVRLGCRHLEVGRAPIEGPRRLVGEHPARVDVGPHVDAPVGDGLERTDGPAELLAVGDVVDGELEGALGAAQDVRQLADGEPVEQPRQEIAIAHG